MFYDLIQQLLILKPLKERYKKPGFSKDGKFKEDQIVIDIKLMKTECHCTTKFIQENTVDSKTFIPFMLEIAKIYDVNNKIIVADKGRGQ